MRLSICIVTMNRAIQLKKAIESCLSCSLPDKTEFIIIDNASTDNTESTVHETLGNSGYHYYYEKLDENIGAGKGRNYAFNIARGEYVYSLDDDAYIDTTANQHFFTSAITLMDNNINIISLTTQIYDTAWNRNRISDCHKLISDELYRIPMSCEGSNLLRRNFFTTDPYFPNDYGYEALPLVLRIFDAGKENCAFLNVRAIHDPKIDRWDYSKEQNYQLLIKDIALRYAIKKMMYPKIFVPFLILARHWRLRKYKKKIQDCGQRVKEVANDTISKYPIGCKIKIRTVLKLFKNFGLSAF